MTAAQVAVLFLLPAAAAFAQPPAVKTTNELPPRIAALVPPGMRVVQQIFTYAPPSLAGVQFSTEKDLPEYHHLTYDFDLRVNNANSPIWSMQGPIYKQQVDRKIAQEAQSPQPSNAVADAPIVTPYGWGSGITGVEDLQGFNYSPGQYDGFHKAFIAICSHAWLSWSARRHSRVWRAPQKHT